MREYVVLWLKDDGKVFSVKLNGKTFFFKTESYKNKSEVINVIKNRFMNIERYPQQYSLDEAKDYVRDTLLKFVYKNSPRWGKWVYATDHKHLIKEAADWGNTQTIFSAQKESTWKGPNFYIIRNNVVTLWKDASWGNWSWEILEIPPRWRWGGSLGRETDNLFNIEFLKNVHPRLTAEGCYSDIGSLSCGRARFRIGDKWGFFDQEGNVFIGAIYDYVRSFSEGYSLVRIGNEEFWINSDGDKISESAPLNTYINTPPSW